MPTVDVEQNIMQLRDTIEKMTQELFRLQGSLRVFMDFKNSGLKVVELPHEPKKEGEPQAEEVAESSTQE